MSIVVNCRRFNGVRIISKQGFSEMLHVLRRELRGAQMIGLIEPLKRGWIKERVIMCKRLSDRCIE